MIRQFLAIIWPPLKKPLNVGKMASGINFPVRGNFNPSRHAEHDALLKLRKKISNRKKHKKIVVDLTVIAVTRSGKYASSRPCWHCIQRILKLLVEWNVKLRMVYYSTAEGTMASEKWNDMKKDNNAHISSGLLRKLKK
jgi:cytidine deaminase